MKLPNWGYLRLSALLLMLAASSRDVTTKAVSGANPFPVSVRVDASKTRGKLRPIYRFFGADEPNYATMKDGRKLLSELGR